MATNNVIIINNKKQNQIVSVGSSSASTTSVPISGSGVVTSVNNKTGAVTLTAADVGAVPSGSLLEYRKSADQDVIDATKVDKVTGKGLSTNDYDDTEKQKVDTANTYKHMHSNKDILDATTQAFTGHQDISGKQDVIQDLTTIRSGAALGATAYQKPAAGIPKADLVEDVQTSLGKADSAYQKPETNIPKIDLATDVQTSLGKADTALQEHQSLAAYRTSANQDIIDNAIKADVDAIEEKIPDQATSSNKLADKEFVNSSIATNTGHYISKQGEPFNSLEELQAYSGTVTNNDYAFVTGTDASGNTFYDRYKATVSGTTVTWAKEYRLNNSSFTAAQWAAISSNITAALVASYNTHIANTDIHVTAEQKTTWTNKQDAIEDLETIRSQAGTAIQPADNVSELTNDAGYLTSATVPTEIFWCTYGTTTYAQIKEQYDAGKEVKCIYNTFVYSLTWCSNRQCCFAACRGDTTWESAIGEILFITVTSGNVWTNTGCTVPKTLYLVYGTTTIPVTSVITLMMATIYSDYRLANIYVHKSMTNPEILEEGGLVLSLSFGGVIEHPSPTTWIFNFDTIIKRDGYFHSCEAKLSVTQSSSSETDPWTATWSYEEKVLPDISYTENSYSASYNGATTATNIAIWGASNAMRAYYVSTSPALTDYSNISSCVVVISDKSSMVPVTHMLKKIASSTNCTLWYADGYFNNYPICGYFNTGTCSYTVGSTTISVTVASAGHYIFCGTTTYGSVSRTVYASSVTYKSKTYGTIDTQFIPATLNPTDTATATLSKLKYGDTVYNVGAVQESPVFVATYNTTSYNDILTAYAAHKVVIAYKTGSSLVYTLQYKSGNSFRFIAFTETTTVDDDARFGPGENISTLICALDGTSTTWSAPDTEILAGHPIVLNYDEAPEDSYNYLWECIDSKATIMCFDETHGDPDDWLYMPFASAYETVEIDEETEEETYYDNWRFTTTYKDTNNKCYLLSNILTWNEDTLEFVSWSHESVILPAVVSSEGEEFTIEWDGSTTGRASFDFASTIMPDMYMMYKVDVEDEINFFNVQTISAVLEADGEEQEFSDLTGKTGTNCIVFFSDETGFPAGYFNAGSYSVVVDGFTVTGTAPEAGLYFSNIEQEEFNLRTVSITGEEIIPGQIDSAYIPGYHTHSNKAILDTILSTPVSATIGYTIDS